MPVALLIPIILEALPSVVSLAEHFFVKGPDNAPTGSLKRTFALGLIDNMLTSLEQHSKLPTFCTENRDILMRLAGDAIDLTSAALFPNQK